ncbi:sulfotransferase 1C4-like isoform X2 [Penaeus japonicus]|nr:sulfotransferase 1C4-like isoform X2 [Penaeus japonicus]XP_042868745.1 sulfotransferase 1C4-like isoform X2 [Penaeus japonicus]
MTSQEPVVTLGSGHKAVPIGEEDMTRLLRNFPTFTDGASRLYPGRWLLLKGFKDVADRIYNFKIRDSDVVVVTFPKSGTTWSQEVVWSMLHDPDLKGAPRSQLMDRAPYLEMEVDQWPTEIKSFVPPLFTAMCPEGDASKGTVVQMLEKEREPRVIKTHLPLSLLPPDAIDKGKVVYVARNPKDLVASFYDYSRTQKRLQFQGSLAEFADHFMRDELRYCPYWEHMREAWQKRNHPNLHFIFFEDLKKDPLREYRKLDAFLGTKLSEEQIARVMEHTSFSSMKARNEALGKDDQIISEGNFFRVGQAGSWKEKLTPELERKIDEWTKENIADFGGDFKYFI